MYILVHWVWDFLSQNDRAWLCHTPMGVCATDQAQHTYYLGWAPALRAYARLRTVASCHSLGYLRQPWFLAIMLPTEIPKRRAYDNAVALLRYDFVYADFVRSMSRLYTYQGCNHDMIWDIIDPIAHIPQQAPNWPPVDFERTFRAMTLGVLLTRHFQCQFASIAQCNLYDNHLTIKTLGVSKTVRKKLSKKKTCPTTSSSRIGYGGSSMAYF